MNTKEYISRYRSFIMGMAILWIAAYHIPVHTQIPILRFLQDTGYGGVDIFIFLSGFGAYYSLEKDRDPLSFMKRRAKRILPSYIPFILVWMIVMKETNQLYVTEILGNLTMSGWWNGDSRQFNWYIDAIWLYYMLAPYLYQSFKKSAKKERALLIWISLSVMASISFWHGLLLMAICRLPLFILGMYIASGNSVGCKNEDHAIWTLHRKLPGKYAKFFWNVCMFLGIGMLYLCLHKLDGYLWHYGLWWYPFLLIVPGLVLDLGMVASWISRCNAVSWLLTLVAHLGMASFEIFLIHLGVFEFIQARWTLSPGVWAILYFAVMIIGYGYYYVTNSLVGRRKSI